MILLIFIWHLKVKNCVSEKKKIFFVLLLHSSHIRYAKREDNEDKSNDDIIPQRCSMSRIVYKCHY
jgi:hypothetical protein